MKKLVVVSLSLAASLLLFGCNNQPAEASKDVPQENISTNDSKPETAKAFALDANLSGNGLTVYHPSSWTWEKGNKNSDAFIIPPCGGSVMISTYTKMSQPVNKESSAAEVDTAFNSYFEGMTKGPSPIITTADYVRKDNGNAVTATAPIKLSKDGISYVGYSWVGVIDYQLCYVTAAVPENADEQYKKTIEEIVRTTVLVKTEEEKPKTKSDEPATKEDKPATPSITPSQSNAKAKALEYLDYSAFSYTGLIEQLEYEKFSTEDATYGADNCGADWNKQVAKKADEYLDYSSFSRDGLIDQLVYEGFTYDQAVYGVDSAGL